MNSKKGILLHKQCFSFLAEDDHDIFIMKTGHTNPRIYAVVSDTPYDAPSIQSMTLSELSAFLKVSEQAIEYAFTRK